MAARRLEIHPAALAELKSALTWYFERSSAAANNLAAELDRVIDLIIEFPQRWPKAEQGARKFVLRRFPFAVVYREK